eukprot:TRINITY_DN21771_c0_g5_i1.p1 TRINITY_DN21771_c0_g5~~TRINITY_DN21771_c0_g5_i1.p1  ORF type:complete len:444 (+),score=65.97 TRINITY_DN21771_c0_g5_i1:53-1384(+)
MVKLFLTADANLALSRLAKQMEALGIATEVLWQEHKIFCEVSLADIEQKIRCLNSVERVFLCLHRETLHEHHELVQDGPNYALMQQWVRDADWTGALGNMNALHGKADVQSVGAGWRWHVDCRRRGGAGSNVRSFDNLVAKQNIREALHAVLGPLGCEHDHLSPTMTVFMILSQQVALLGVPIFQRLVKKGSFPHKGLHHATAWGLALTARLQPGEVVLDPMAGKGIILLEAASFWPECTFIGVEIDTEQLEKARENVVALQTSQCAFLRGDARSLPLIVGSVDVAMCDLPYGRQHGNASDFPTLYACVMSSLVRVLRPGGRAVLLTSEEHKDILLTAAREAGGPGSMQLVESLPLRFGGYRDRQSCSMCCFRRVGDEAHGQSDHVRSESVADCFDLRLARDLAEGTELSWKDVKPSVSLYKPWKVGAGASSGAAGNARPVAS